MIEMGRRERWESSLKLLNRVRPFMMSMCFRPIVIEKGENRTGRKSVLSLEPSFVRALSQKVASQDFFVPVLDGRIFTQGWQICWISKNFTPWIFFNPCYLPLVRWILLITVLCCCLDNFRVLFENDEMYCSHSREIVNLTVDFILKCWLWTFFEKYVIPRVINFNR